MSIHSENPFSVPVDQRDPVRRLRGRLAAPVTILTAQDERPAGITVSSFFVIEGEIPRAAALIGSGSEFLDAAESSGRFVAHVLTEECRVIADIFAGLRPAPGGMFANVSTEVTVWGPRLSEVSDWAGCRLEEVRPFGDQLVIVGEIEDLSVSELDDPLIYFRGTYRRLAP
ncbi:MAG TPA: flavin reductase family protein [Acidimicrobiia bacterium]|nr:flavin reductase family protein [Acidimicrobiia bacterium]